MQEDRRRRLRVPVPEQLQVSLALWGGIRVLDLSETGALIEHVEPLVLGAACLLALRLGGAELRLPARVVWSQVHSLTPTPRSEEVRYRSGLEFIEIPAGAKAQIGRFLASLSGEGGGGVPLQE